MTPRLDEGDEMGVREKCDFEVLHEAQVVWIGPRSAFLIGLLPGAEILNKIDRPLSRHHQKSMPREQTANSHSDRSTQHKGEGT